MSYITKLLIMWCFRLCLADNKINIIQNSTTWYEALRQCAVQNTRLADISDIKTDQTCNTIIKTNKTKSFWTGNFYKLSNRISIEGCYNTNSQNTEIGFKLLYECFQLCSGRMNTSGFFAYRAIFRRNCICDLNFNNSSTKNPKKIKTDQCLRYDPDLRFFWWVYKVHSNDFNTGNETCDQPACVSADAKYDNVCGQISQKYSNLISHIPEDKLPFICEKNGNKSTSVNDTIYAGYFRFGFNASVKSDHMDKPTAAYKCKAISCNNDNSYQISLQNCNSTNFGYLCVTNSSHETKNQSQTIEYASTSTSTTSKSLSVSTKESQYQESKTGDEITTQSNFQQQTSDVPSHSSPDNVENNPSVSTPSTQSSLEGKSKPTRLNITSGYTTTNKITAQYNFHQQTSDVLSHSSLDNIINIQVAPTSSVHTSAKNKFETISRHIKPSFTRINPSVLKDGEILESTTGVSETPSNSHHRIGVIICAMSAAVVVVVSVVLFVICRLRRLGPFMKKRFVDDSPINDLNFQDIDDTSNQSSPDVHNTMYDIHTVSGDDTRFGLLDVTHDNSNNIRNNEYAVVVKNNQSGNQVVGHNCDMNGRNSNDMVENGCNRVNHVRLQSGNNSSNSRNNEYAVVVKRNQSSNQEVEQNCSTNGENSDDMLESEYDKLNHVRPRSDKGSNNLYDSALGFRDDYDATYHTTDYKRIDKGDDSVYDHT